MDITDEEVIGKLTSGGIPIERWISLNSHLVGYFDEAGCLVGRIVEDNALAAATSELLRKRGQIRTGYEIVPKT